MSKLRLLPLAMTQVNWQVMKDLGSEVVGVSPTRELDSRQIDLNSPSSFLAALGFDNKPVEALREHNNFEHFMVSFIGIMDTDTIVEIVSSADIKIATVDGQGKYKRDKLVVFSGSMNAWIHACIHFCSLNVDYDIRDCFNDVYCRFKDNGFKHSFENYTRVQQQDETFTLERL